MKKLVVNSGVFPRSVFFPLPLSFFNLSIYFCCDCVCIGLVMLLFLGGEGVGGRTFTALGIDQLGSLAAPPVSNG